MARTNVKSKHPRIVSTVTTHEGGTPAIVHSREHELKRAVVSCFLGEDQFYESGILLKDRIRNLAAGIEPEKVAALAIEARHVHQMRHVPLWLLVTLAKTGSGIPHLVQDTVEAVVSRPDEMGELLSLYWEVNGKDSPISAQLKKGLARASLKFDQYQLTKWNKDSAAIAPRDVIFLTHPDPGHKAKLFADFVNKDHYPNNLNNLGSWEKLSPPWTWEVELSKPGADKNKVFTDLLVAGKLGYDALLKNLRNMTEAKVDRALIEQALVAGKGIERIHPFRFLTAAKYAPGLEDAVNEAFLMSIRHYPKLEGKTCIIVDVSGSMYGGHISAKSEINRAQAASALAAVLRETCATVSIYATAGNDGTRIHKTELVPNRRGIPLAEYIHSRSTPLGGGGIFLKQVNEYVRNKEGTFDRYICITDEQDTSGGGANAPSNAPLIAKKNYMLNVASYRPGITFDSRWIKIEGFSNNTAKFIIELEKFGYDTAQRLSNSNH